MTGIGLAKPGKLGYNSLDKLRYYAARAKEEQQMSTIITSVDRHSPAERAGIAAGEQLLTINGHEIIDVLDYRFYGYDTDCRLELREPSGAVRTVSLRKPEGRDLGLNFDTVLMDEMRSCANHCISALWTRCPPVCGRPCISRTTTPG